MESQCEVILEPDPSGITHHPWQVTINHLLDITQNSMTTQFAVQMVN